VPTARFCDFLLSGIPQAVGRAVDYSRILGARILTYEFLIINRISDHRRVSYVTLDDE
jgi:hypothetical protein